MTTETPWPPSWSIHDRVRKLREIAGVEQAELASITGLSRVTISNYERGAVTPTASNLAALALAVAPRIGVLGEDVLAWLRST